MFLNKRFKNPHITRIYKNVFDVFLWQIGYFDEGYSGSKVPESFSYPMPNEPLDEDKPQVTWINHCTFLISINEINILTDPIWSKRCSPLSFFGPQRTHAPAIHINDLPTIHYVLISHNHYDHLDKDTVMQLHEKFPEITWIVPTGVKKWFVARGILNVEEIAWWEEKALEHLKVTGVPTQHFSGRSLFDTNRTLWTGYVVEIAQKRFYFVGDTGYNPHDFKDIGAKFGSMDLSLIPIGTYIPRKFMSPVHIEPNDSVKIHREVGSRLSVGMHWKTFLLSDEAPHQPPYDLLQALEKERIDPKTFLAIQPGQTINW